jgi:hypothetical protein
LPEGHIVISNPDGAAGLTLEGIMSVNCDVILRWDATSDQRQALGAALWGWCRHKAGDAGIYRYLDDQPLADLLAGRFPARDPMARSTDLPQISFSVRGEPARDREGILDSLRRALPSAGIADVRADGMSQRRAEAKERPF